MLTVILATKGKKMATGDYGGTTTSTSGYWREFTYTVIRAVERSLGKPALWLGAYIAEIDAYILRLAGAWKPDLRAALALHGLARTWTAVRHSLGLTRLRNWLQRAAGHREFMGGGFISGQWIAQG